MLVGTGSVGSAHSTSICSRVIVAQAEIDPHDAARFDRRRPAQREARCRVVRGDLDLGVAGVHRIDDPVTAMDAGCRAHLELRSTGPSVRLTRDDGHLPGGIERTGRALTAERGVQAFEVRGVHRTEVAPPVQNVGKTDVGDPENECDAVCVVPGRSSCENLRGGRAFSRAPFDDPCGECDLLDEAARVGDALQRELRRPAAELDGVVADDRSPRGHQRCRSRRTRSVPWSSSPRSRSDAQRPDRHAVVARDDRRRRIRRAP